MTINILVLGHIIILQKLLKKGNVIIGLLTTNALRGYKKEITPFKERLEILKALNLGVKFKIVPQDTLDPFNNLKKYKCTHLASGDGFEECEIESAKKLGVKLLDINSGSPTHSSDVNL